jgi:acyl carrier protein
MNKRKIKAYVINLLNKFRLIESNDRKNIDKFDFIDSGHLDSIEILKFNLEVEKKFKIRFKPIETTLKRYKTVEGLTSIIYKKLSNKVH